MHVDYTRLITSLIDTAENLSGLPLLRVHWYDSARNGVPNCQQERIGELSKVKLRLGRFGVDGEQKGVDLRIGLDLVTHAQHNTSDVFFLVSGDDDLTEAVEEAQAHGIQVEVLAVPGPDNRARGVARHLLRAVDQLHVLDGANIDDSVIKIEAPKPDAEPTPASKPATATTAATPLDAAAAARGPRPAAAPSTPPAKTPNRGLVYTSTTGSEGRQISDYPRNYLDAHEDLAVLDDVIKRVLASYLATTDGDGRRRLTLVRPLIPQDVDRALLLDASHALQQYALDESIRFSLRQRFWHLFDCAQAS
ncbi:hypothetical protein UG54_01575 [Gordonia sihwensis]|nr:hypothetical protein UG54_01575 [Gordonia sihwensis]